jgi:hypothetical protein
MENIGRPEDEWNFLLGKDNNNTSLKIYRKPREPSKVIDMTEALEAAERLSRKIKVERIQKNIIIKQQKRYKGDRICRNQKTLENSQKRYQNYKAQ